MRLGVILCHGQVFWVFLAALVCASCGGESAEVILTLPETPPLTRTVIGYGVISSSYTHVAAEPSSTGLSLGYMRKGAIVEVLERRSVNRDGAVESWVFVGGTYRGWLREDVIQVYTSEAQAATAAESLVQ
jgi:hypothetical protein